jgi:hypothetical protein
MAMKKQYFMSGEYKFGEQGRTLEKSNSAPGGMLDKLSFALGGV